MNFLLGVTDEALRAKIDRKSAFNKTRPGINVSKIVIKRVKSTVLLKNAPKMATTLLLKAVLSVRSFVRSSVCLSLRTPRW